MSGATTPAAQAERAKLVYNERIKLLANALDRASTAMGAGSFWPLINLSRPTDGRVDAAALTQFCFGASAFLISAVLIHFLARKALGRLR
jgi:hypothetical protein